MTTITHTTTPTEQELREMTGNTFFSVRFTKKCGEVRDMQCRFNVVKHLRGGEDSTKHLSDIVTVFADKTDTSYRKFSLSRLQQLKAKGVTHIFKGA